MVNKADTDGFFECVDIENDEFQSVHDGSDRSELDSSSNWNLDTSMATSDGDESESGRSGDMSSDRSGRFSVKMYGNDFKVEVHNVHNFSGAFEDSEHSSASANNSDYEMDDTMDTGNLADESYKNLSVNISPGGISGSPNTSLLSGDLAERMMIQETPPRSNATGRGKAAVDRALANPSCSLFTGELIPMVDGNSVENSTGTLSTQDSLLGNENVMITPSFSNDDDVNNPPSLQRQSLLPDIGREDREDEYTIASVSEYSIASGSTGTVSSVGTFDSFQSVFSDMSKLRSLMKGEMESFASSSGTNSNRSVNRSTEINAARMIAEELAKIEAREKAATMIADAATLMSADISAEERVRREIAMINKEEQARVLEEEIEVRRMAEIQVLAKAGNDSKVQAKAGKDTKAQAKAGNDTKVQAKAENDTNVQMDKAQVRRDKEDAAREVRAQEKANIRESVARVTHAENELKRLEGEAQHEHKRKAKRMRADAEAMKIRYEEDELRKIEEDQERKRVEAGRVKAEEAAKIKAGEEECLRKEAEALTKKEEERIAAESLAKKEEEERVKAEALAQKEEEERLAAKELAKKQETQRLAAEVLAKKEEEERLAAEALAKRLEEERIAAEALA